MDWFSWLSKTGLDPILVYEYGVAFAQNELVQDDIPYFNHEFLQSMGISIAKHRLEILKLASRSRSSHRHRRAPVSTILIATKRCLSKCLRAWTRRREESPSTALALVPRRTWWKSSTAKRSNSSRRLQTAVKQISAAPPPLLLTNGSPMVFGSARVDSFASPNFGDDDRDFDDDRREMDGGDCGDGKYWSSAVEEIRWDTMFQNLKPT